MDKLRNSTHETYAAFASERRLEKASLALEEMKRVKFLSRMLIVMSVKPTLTHELLKVNSALKLIFSVIEDQCSGGQ